PDVVVMDISLPGMNGLECIRHITRKGLAAKCLVLTMHESEEFLFHAIEAGAQGYVLKRGAHTDLIEAIRTVSHGDAFLYPSAVKRLVQDYVERVETGEEKRGYDDLTRRQHEVLLLTAQGYTNQEIADRLVLSAKTVEKHKAELMRKLGLSNRAALVQYALRKGLLTPED
ncbi:MAG: response regulator transcription factor, partial [Chloroflexota bacterium]